MSFTRLSLAGVFVISLVVVFSFPSPCFAQWTKTIDCPDGRSTGTCAEMPAERSSASGSCQALSRCRMVPPVGGSAKDTSVKRAITARGGRLANGRNATDLTGVRIVPTR
jgi:hypothetical protein